MYHYFILNAVFPGRSIKTIIKLLVFCFDFDFQWPFFIGSPSLPWGPGHLKDNAGLRHSAAAGGPELKEGLSVTTAAFIVP